MKIRTRKKENDNLEFYAFVVRDVKTLNGIVEELYHCCIHSANNSPVKNSTSKRSPTVIHCFPHISFHHVVEYIVQQALRERKFPSS